jgi:hypothetical protein
MSSRRPTNNSSDADARIEELQKTVEELQRLVASNQSAPAAPRSEEAKARNPKPFDGEDPAQLHAFLIQVRLALELKSLEYPDERSKILYAISYLEGGALSWAHPLFRRADPPPYMTDFELFAEKLEHTFGDPEMLISEQLRQLKQTGSVSKYSGDFRRLATRVDWNAASLVSQFYSGLKYPIKLELAKVKRPEELEDLVAMAISLDNLQQQQLATLNKTSQLGDQLPRKEYRPRVSLATNANPRLTEQQREFRRRNGLCLYCGGEGHILRNCPTRPKAPPRPAHVSEAFMGGEPLGNAQAQMQ